MSILEFLEQWYDNYLWLYHLNDKAHQMNITRYTQNPRFFNFGIGSVQGKLDECTNSEPILCFSLFGQYSDEKCLDSALFSHCKILMDNISPSYLKYETIREIRSSTDFAKNMKKICAILDDSVDFSSIKIDEELLTLYKICEKMYSTNSEGVILDSDTMFFVETTSSGWRIHADIEDGIDEAKLTCEYENPKIKQYDARLSKSQQNWVKLHYDHSRLSAYGGAINLREIVQFLNVVLLENLQKHCGVVL